MPKYTPPLIITCLERMLEPRLLAGVFMLVMSVMFFVLVTVML
jgi:hypothetical protein